MKLGDFKGRTPPLWTLIHWESGMDEAHRPRTSPRTHDLPCDRIL